MCKLFKVLKKFYVVTRRKLFNFISLLNNYESIKSVEQVISINRSLICVILLFVYTYQHAIYD